MYSIKIIYKLVNKHLTNVFITLNMKNNYWVSSNSLNYTYHQDMHQFSADIINVIHSSSGFPKLFYEHTTKTISKTHCITSA